MNHVEETGETVAASTAARYRAYRSRIVDYAEATTWVQIDLGTTRSIEAVTLHPAHRVLTPGDGFPQRFRIECAQSAELREPQLLVDHSRVDYPDPRDRVVRFSAPGIDARYVRLTVLRLRRKKRPEVPIELPGSGNVAYLFSLSRIGVYAGGEDVAVHRPVSVDASLGNANDASQLTRDVRPQGEGVITDNPANVSSPQSWRRPHGGAQPPRGNVHLRGGLFQKAMENNIAYLLASGSVDDLLRPFRERAGRAVPASGHTPHPFWERELPGSSAGRFLMGAANTLRWIEHAELRARMDAVVRGIAECQQPDGYIMAYPQSALFASEHGAYSRSWTTHGLIDAGYAGNERAFSLLRQHYDGFNRSEYLPQMLRRCGQGGQGMIANTRLHFTPVGQPADIQVIQRYFQENYWLDALASRRPEAIAEYPYDRPHAYLLTNVEAYLDLYLATGEARYLAAVEGAWDLFRQNWQNVGGSISLIEMTECEPGTHRLYTRLGETCASTFWVLLNQRLHTLHPERESYVAEIEKSLYNVLFANQHEAHGIRYHAMLLGQKEPATRINTCCEGQGTRILASLPEYIYSIAADGLYVNLYEPSTIEWLHAGTAMRVTLDSRFPRDGLVTLTVDSPAATRLALHVRVPCWADQAVTVQVNGKPVATGAPGSYVTLDRTWSAGDRVAFALPMSWRMTKYTGADRIAGRERFALEYGPLLMAALGAVDCEIVVPGSERATDLTRGLRADNRDPGHFVFDGLYSPVRFVPYFEVADEHFSCFPFVSARLDVP